MPRRRQAILLAYLTLGAFFISHSLNAFVSQALVKPVQGQAFPVAMALPVPTKEGSARLAEEILNSGLFMSPPGLGPGGRTDALPPMKPIDAGKKIKLVGTVVGDGVSALAVLEDLQSRKQLLYHLYERIPDVGQIVEVRRDGMIVQEGQQREFVALVVPNAVQGVAVPVAAPTQPAALGARTTKTRHSIDRRVVTQSMADVPKLLTQAQAGPFYQDGKLAGWKIESIKAGSFYEQVGLQPGDVIQRINGVEIRDPGMMLTLFQQVKDETQVKLDLLRDNQRTTLNYDIR